MEARKDFLTEAECRNIASLMERKYASFLKQRQFEAVATKDGKGVYTKVVLRNEDGSFYYPVEARIADLDHDMSAYDAGLFLLDYIDAYFAEYFRGDGEVYLPIDWADYDCDGVPFQIKGQILNLALERMADQLLTGSDRPAGQEPH